MLHSNDIFMRRKSSTTNYVHRKMIKIKYRFLIHNRENIIDLPIREANDTNIYCTNRSCISATFFVFCFYEIESHTKL